MSHVFTADTLWLTQTNAAHLFDERLQQTTGQTI